MKYAANRRHAGVLLHVSSLPSGDLGPDAYRFIDFLSEIGAKVWQTLPLNMPHGDRSPYQCLSAHAGDTAFISLHRLAERGWLLAEEVTGRLSDLGDKERLVTKAFAQFKQKPKSAEYAAFKRFCKKNAFWLNDFALFLLLRKQYQCISWNKWPLIYKKRDAQALSQLSKLLKDELETIKFSQYMFFMQWHELKAYANKKGIAIFGDIPIFVAYDSADVWASPQSFKLDARCNMKVVAGVPPDYFSETGQRWGNPHYNWRAMKADGFKWWLERMSTQYQLFDMVRIDHFRGLQAAWEIPAKEDTAINGKWVLAPGDALLTTIKQHFPKMCLVAEDLGIITEEVNALRHKFNLPGMKILQFAFGGGDDNYYLPANIEPNSVVYTGTHDNDTSLGWYQTLEVHAKQHLHVILDSETPNMPFDLIKLALNTRANLAIIPMQDVLELDGSNRMNTPGTLENNWRWRFDWVQLSPHLQIQIAEAIRQSGRAK
jgi:4-alpha-glucanotransferase